MSMTEPTDSIERYKKMFEPYFEKMEQVIIEGEKRLNEIATSLEGKNTVDARTALKMIRIDLETLAECKALVGPSGRQELECDCKRAIAKLEATKKRMIARGHRKTSR